MPMIQTGVSVGATGLAVEICDVILSREQIGKDEKGNPILGLVDHSVYHVVVEPYDGEPYYYGYLGSTRLTLSLGQELTT